MEKKVDTNSNGLDNDKQNSEIISVSTSLGIICLGVEHAQTTNKTLVELARINEIIGTIDGVIFEYFPPDMDQEFTRRLAQDTINYYYTVQKMLEGQNKNAYCLDPAHDHNFDYIAAAQLTLPTGLALTGGMTYRFSRRKFLKAVGAGTMGLAVAGIMGSVSHIAELMLESPILATPNYQNFRRVVIAYNILKLSQKLEAAGEKMSLGLCYPPTHIEAIKRLLNNPEFLNAAYDVINKVGQNIPKNIMDSFFSMRNYEYVDKRWVLRHM